MTQINPPHSYQKMLYKYPQAAFPYSQLVEENRRRGKGEPEFELVDALREEFAQGRYFDVFIEYHDSVILAFFSPGSAQLAEVIHGAGKLRSPL